MYHTVKHDGTRDDCTISACVEHDFDVASDLTTRWDSDESDDVVALTDLVQDEWGSRNALYEGGELFEIVAVPDDVAGNMEPDNGSGLAVQYCGWCGSGFHHRGECQEPGF